MTDMTENKEAIALILLKALADLEEQPFYPRSLAKMANNVEAYKNILEEKDKLTPPEIIEIVQDMDLIRNYSHAITETILFVLSSPQHFLNSLVNAGLLDESTEEDEILENET